MTWRCGNASPALFCDRHPGTTAPGRFNRADRQELEAGRLDHGGVGRFETLLGNGQGEHVIFSPGNREVHRIGTCRGRDFPHPGHEGNLFAPQPDRNPGGPGEMTEVGRETVTDVDHRARSGPGQDRGRGQLGLRPYLALNQEIAGQATQIRDLEAAQQSQARRGTADRTGHSDDISRSSPRTRKDRSRVIDVSDDGDAEEDHRRCDHVAAGQLHSELGRRRDDSVGQPFKVPVRRFRRGAESDEDLGFTRAQTHRRQIRDCAGERFAGAFRGRPVRSEMNSFDRGVDRGDDSVLGPDHCRVIADADFKPVRRGDLPGDPPDQLELAQVHGSDTIAPQMREEPDKPSLLHRLGHLAATVGKTGPKKKSTKIILQGTIAFLIFGFLVFTVVSQWSELKEKGVEFDFTWLIPAIAMMMLYYVAGAAVWGLILRFLGSPVPAMEAQKIWAQPLLVRYIPGTVLFLLARILMAEKAGVQRRVTTAGIVYEQAVSIAGALTIATWFLIDHPDLQSQPARWLPLLVLPAMVLLLHPRIFGPVSKRLLHALGRESLPQLMPFRGVVSIYLSYVVVWAIMGIGVFFAARAVHHLNLDDLVIVAASQMIGFLAAVISAVTPAGLGVRDAAFAWAVKVALPSDSFGVGAVIAIAVRATQTVVELIYVGAVTALTRKEGDEDEIELAEEAAEEAARL